jgi:hypothetical protein
MRIELYVPSTVNVSESADRALVRAERTAAEQTVCRLFGGCTTTFGWGCYVDNRGSLVRERVAIVATLADGARAEAGYIALREYARALAARMSQECVMLSRGGVAEFVTPVVTIEAAE